MGPQKKKRKRKIIKNKDGAADSHTRARCGPPGHERRENHEGDDETRWERRTKYQKNEEILKKKIQKKIQGRRRRVQRPRRRPSPSSNVPPI